MSFEFLVGDGIAAAGAEPSGSYATHERAALAALLAQEACFALGALVDGARLARLSGGQPRRCQYRWLMAAAPQALAAAIRAGNAGSPGWQGVAADETATCYGTVTRRDSGRAGGGGHAAWVTAGGLAR